MRTRLCRAPLAGQVARFLTSVVLCAPLLATSGAAAPIPTLPVLRAPAAPVPGNSIDVFPGAAVPERVDDLQTFTLMRISPSGAITGSYLDNRLRDHGFVRDAKGTVTTFDVPAPLFELSTTPTDINAAGTIVGNSQCCGAFVRTADGNVTTFVLPGGGAASAQAINPGGVITGAYFDGAVRRGYVRSNHGAFETFDVPGAQDMSPTDISPEGIVIGQALIGSGSVGFVRSADGALGAFNVPGATGTFPRAINSAGTIAGIYQDDAQLSHGFVRTRDGTITTLDVGPNGQTLAFDINQAGVIVGVFTNDGGPVGFIREPSGRVTKISVPGALYTSAHTINAAGTVAGIAGGHGFVRDSRGAITTFDIPPQADLDDPIPVDLGNRGGRVAIEAQASRQADAEGRVAFAYTLAANSDASIAVYDIAGRRVADLLNHEMQAAGPHEVSWTTAHVARGVYFIRLTAGALSQTKTVAVLH